MTAPDIHNLLDNPFEGLDFPYQRADYFELFVRLDLLKSEEQRLSTANYADETMRQKDLARVRKAVAAVERHTHNEQINSIQRSDGKPKKSAARDQVIFDAIVKLGFDPASIPPAKGKAGVKAAVREEVTRSHIDLFQSNGVFDDAWKRLRTAQVIKTAKS